MKNKKVEANLSLVLARTFNGLNYSALKYLLPIWILPLSTVAIRCAFAAVVFWIISLFYSKDNTTLVKDKFYLFLLGALCIFGYLCFFQVGLNMTTPISSSIFSSLQPIWVFIIAAVFFHEEISKMKIFGIFIGFGGALLCILTQQSSDLASDAKTGNLLCLFSSVLYAVYLTVEKIFIEKKIPIITVLKYTFTGAMVSGLIMTAITGFHAPVLESPIHSKPFLVLIYVLIFPTVVGYLLIPIGLKYLKATVVSMYGYLVLIVVAITSLVLGQDRFDPLQMVAILLICASIYFIEIAENKK